MRIGSIDVWLVDLDGPVPLDLLDAAELQRAARILRPRPARRWAASRAVLAALRAAYDDSPHVSVSHSGGIGLIAVAAAPVGVDVEHERSVGRNLRVARRAFGASCAERLSRLPRVQREREFLQLWTTREALFKLGTRHGAWTADVELGGIATATVAAAAPHAVRVRRWG